jgi:hypothetical protein
LLLHSGELRQPVGKHSDNPRQPATRPPWQAASVSITSLFNNLLHHFFRPSLPARHTQHQAQKSLIVTDVESQLVLFL